MSILFVHFHNDDDNDVDDDEKWEKVFFVNEGSQYTNYADPQWRIYICAVERNDKKAYIYLSPSYDKPWLSDNRQPLVISEINCVL